jgi:hypothetical protein
VLGNHAWADDGEEDMWIVLSPDTRWGLEHKNGRSIKGDVKNIFLPPPGARYSSRHPALSPLQGPVSCLQLILVVPSQQLHLHQ